jgi:hypothetical protein
MFTNQLSWSGSFGLVVTLPSFGTGGLGSVSPGCRTCGVTLPFLLQLIKFKQEV